jgi:hypothetical protein
MAEAAPIVSGDYPGLTLCDGEQDWYSVKLTAATASTCSWTPTRSSRT